MYHTKFYKNTLSHAKTTTLHLYPEQELHSDEMFYRPCVSMGDIIWQQKLKESSR